MKWLLLLALALPPLYATALELDSPKAPAGLQMFWIAEYMEFNDIPMSIRSFKTREQASSVIPRLKEHLENIGSTVQVTQDNEGWTTLATADENRFYSIRLTSGQTETEGVYTVSARSPAKESETRLPLGFIRIEKQVFFDGPSVQEFTVLGTQSGQSEALAVVERMMTNDGWSTTRNYRSTRYFSRQEGQEHAHATAQPGEKGMGTLILISKELTK
ncbi:hypothetical protein [Marinobacterium sp. BA1]|uniref:hypothetical protein n=1 Tax=Marinobacterium sp. BA1 TaxID=3138931 RepID=UPI0032E7F4EE